MTQNISSTHALIRAAEGQERETAMLFGAWRLHPWDHRDDKHTWKFRCHDNTEASRRSGSRTLKARNCCVHSVMLFVEIQQQSTCNSVDVTTIIIISWGSWTYISGVFVIAHYWNHVPVETLYAAYLFLFTAPIYCPEDHISSSHSTPTFGNGCANLLN
jgi:hypothetical protein